MPRKQYDSARGGHAPRYLTKAFRDVFVDEMVPEDISFPTAKLQSQWDAMGDPSDGMDPEYHGDVDRSLWLIKQLINCTDVMPPMACEELDMPEGTTYGGAALHLRRMGFDAVKGGRNPL